MNILNEPRSVETILDQLVVSQIEQLIACEKALEKRYSILLTAPTIEDSETWTIEVRQLNLRTDRLARMLDALEGTYAPPNPSEEIANPAA